MMAQAAGKCLVAGRHFSRSAHAGADQISRLPGLGWPRQDRDPDRGYPGQSATVCDGGLSRGSGRQGGLFGGTFLYVRALGRSFPRRFETKCWNDIWRAVDRVIRWSRPLNIHERSVFTKGPASSDHRGYAWSWTRHLAPICPSGRRGHRQLRARRSGRGIFETVSSSPKDWRSSWFVRDLTNSKGIESLVSAVGPETSRLSCLIHCAATGVHRPFDQLTMRHFDWTFGLNLRRLRARSAASSTV